MSTESAVLLKNDASILPLSKDMKVFVTGSSKETAKMDREAVAAYAQVVDTLAEADVVIARVTSMDDNTEMIIEDAASAGKPVVLVAQVGNKENEISTTVA